jgi:hypothetical protein
MIHLDRNHHHTSPLSPKQNLILPQSHNDQQHNLLWSSLSHDSDKPQQQQHTYFTDTTIHPAFPTLPVPDDPPTTPTKQGPITPLDIDGPVLSHLSAPLSPPSPTNESPHHSSSLTPPPVQGSSPSHVDLPEPVAPTEPPPDPVPQQQDEQHFDEPQQQQEGQAGPSKGQESRQSTPLTELSPIPDGIVDGLDLVDAPSEPTVDNSLHESNADNVADVKEVDASPGGNPEISSPGTADPKLESPATIEKASPSMPPPPAPHESSPTQRKEANLHPPDRNSLPPGPSLTSADPSAPPDPGASRAPSDPPPTASSQVQDSRIVTMLDLNAELLRCVNPMPLVLRPYRRSFVVESAWSSKTGPYP